MEDVFSDSCNEDCLRDVLVVDDATSVTPVELSVFSHSLLPVTKPLEYHAVKRNIDQLVRYIRLQLPVTLGTDKLYITLTAKMPFWVNVVTSHRLDFSTRWTLLKLAWVELSTH